MTTAETDTKLVAALKRQETMWEELNHLRTSNNYLKLMVGLLLAVVILCGGLANWARVTAERSDAATRAVVANGEADQAERDATALVACRLRNAASRGTREQFGRYNDALASLVTSPNGQAAIGSCLDRSAEEFSN